MMNLLVRYKMVVFALAFAVIGFVVYTTFFPSRGGEPTLATEEVTSPEEAENQDLIALLYNLRAITLDNAIFSDPIFMSLVDFSQVLVAEPVGRENPFAPLNAPTATP